MDNKIKIELTVEEMHSIMAAIEGYRIHLINTAVKNGDEHRFDNTIERLGTLDAALYRKLTSFLYDEVELSEKEEAPLATAQRDDFLEKEVREELTGTLSEAEFIRIADRLYDLAHNPTVRNAKTRVFPDIKLSMYRFK